MLLLREPISARAALVILMALGIFVKIITTSGRPRYFNNGGGVEVEGAGFIL